ncbi:amidase domain-containing protein [Paenibacillus sp. GD4]|uniref:amidase domain-containing protein n=1 Tax=Paenibacillus sp. GD4 TaxID=3068890 RepID=UPI0027968012|nr:amidase domain-containing protein [Paenibacillus sp. GD4]MDQ1913383.1 amidase domain-containing protein [Paenibacillus sp. GD4]
MKIIGLWLGLAACLMFPGFAHADTPEQDALQTVIEQIYQQRAEALLLDAPERIQSQYMKNEKISQYAYKHEVKRSEYIHAWAEKREVQFVEIKSDIHIQRMKVGKNSAKVSLSQSMKLTYAYPQHVGSEHSFGIGTRHTLALEKVDGQWRIRKEWYLDPLEEDPKQIPLWVKLKEQLTIEAGESETKPSEKKHVRYDRAKAVQYADKYAGLAWGAGNNHKYNGKYNDYTGQGGDCTNFSSQVLGDPKEGGGLGMTGYWRYRPGYGGSEAWVRTDSLKNFLIGRGYARVVARGTYGQVSKTSAKFPQGAFAQMKPGDLIAYEIHGDIDHFSVLTGFDPQGYPLVNSHTADRYRVPWDLGWDKSTVFWLIHVRD